MRGRGLESRNAWSLRLPIRGGSTGRSVGDQGPAETRTTQQTQRTELQPQKRNALIHIDLHDRRGLRRPWRLRLVATATEIIRIVFCFIYVSPQPAWIEAERVKVMQCRFHAKDI